MLFMGFISVLAMRLGLLRPTRAGSHDSLSSLPIRR